MPKHKHVAQLTDEARAEYATAVRHYNLLLTKLHDLIDVACANLNATTPNQSANLLANEAVLTAVLLKFPAKFDEIVSQDRYANEIIRAFKLAASEFEEILLRMQETGNIDHTVLSPIQSTLQGIIKFDRKSESTFKSNVLINFAVGLISMAAYCVKLALQRTLPDYYRDNNNFYYVHGSKLMDKRTANWLFVYTLCLSMGAMSFILFLNSRGKENNASALYRCSSMFNKFYQDFDRVYQDSLVTKQSPATKAQTLLYDAEKVRTGMIAATEQADDDLERGTGLRQRR